MVVLPVTNRITFGLPTVQAKLTLAALRATPGLTGLRVVRLD